MSMNNSDMIKIILEYVKDERYRQAVLIDGEWGVGKTFFITEYLINELKKEIQNKKIYYISLYGISSAKQIIDEIYSAMVEEFIESKVGSNSGKVLEKGISFTSKLFAAGMKYVNIEKDDLPQLSDLKDIKRAIIVFDDLERCELDINQTLGVINNLVEHNDVRVILVANQNEIGKMNFLKEITDKYMLALDDRLILDDNTTRGVIPNKTAITYTKQQLIERAEKIFDEDLFYKKVKEKLIGLTVYYCPELTDVFDDVIKKLITNQKELIFLQERKETIISIFEEQKHFNIRTLNFALIAFDKFYNVICEINFDELYIIRELERVLNYTLKSAIKIKLGIATYSWENTTSKSGIVFYDRKNLWESMLYGYRFVDEYLSYGIFDKENIESSILEVVKEKQRDDQSMEITNSLVYNKLHIWWELEDDEIEKYVKEMLCELQAKKYGPGYFKNIIIILMQLTNNGFENIDFDEYIKPMIEIMEEVQGKFETREFEVLSDDNEFKSKYNEMMKPVLDVLNKKETILKKRDNSFLSERSEWNDKFEEKCNKIDYISEQKFFFYINIDVLLKSFKEANTREIYNFLDGVKKVYSFSNLNEFFKDDVANLRDIIDRLLAEDFCDNKKTKKIAMDKVTQKLKESLELIKK